MKHISKKIERCSKRERRSVFYSAVFYIAVIALAWGGVPLRASADEPLERVIDFSHTLSTLAEEVRSGTLSRTTRSVIITANVAEITIVSQREDSEYSEADVLLVAGKWVGLKQLETSRVLVRIRGTIPDLHRTMLVIGPVVEVREYHDGKPIAVINAVWFRTL